MPKNHLEFAQQALRETREKFPLGSVNIKPAAHQNEDYKFSDRITINPTLFSETA